MNIVESLTQLDLTDREAKIYAALLEMGQASPLQLSKKTGLKRPTVYLDLESLRRKQLAGLTFKGKKTVYTPDPPSRLLQRAQQQEQVTRELLPHLRALENTGGTKPVIRYYDDLKDIERVWVNECFNAAENLYISDYASTLNLFPDTETKAQAQMKRGVIKVMREIHPDTPLSRQLCASYPRQVGREYRFLPPGLKYDIDISIWDTTVAIYSNPKRYMLVITDEAISQGFRTMFEATWMISRDPKKPPRAKTT